MALLKRLIFDPKGVFQKISLKYSYKLLPNLLNFRALRGFKSIAEYQSFYNQFDTYCFVVPLGMAYNYMRQRPQQIAFHISKYMPVLYYTGALFFNSDHVKDIKKIKKNFFLINDGMNGNTIFKVPQKVYYIFWPIDHYFYIKDDKESYVIYDYLDEIDITPRYNKQTLKLHEYLLHRANLILASSEKLYSQIPEKYRDKTLLITNGVDIEHFNISYEYVQTKNMYTIGFYGALEKWIDIDLIERIAKTRKFKIKLIGPVIDVEFNRLRSFSNIEMLGHQDYKILPELVQNIDVFILPFKLNELTKSVSPVKLFEHFATGKPVVSTALPECMKYDTVFIMDKENCIEVIENAIAHIGEADYIRKAKQYAKENSWSQKVKRIVDRLSDDLGYSY